MYNCEVCATCCQDVAARGPTKNKQNKALTGATTVHPEPHRSASPTARPSDWCMLLLQAATKSLAVRSVDAGPLTHCARLCSAPSRLKCHVCNQCCWIRPSRIEENGEESAFSRRQACLTDRSGALACVLLTGARCSQVCDGV